MFPSNPNFKSNGAHWNLAESTRTAQGIKSWWQWGKQRSKTFNLYAYKYIRLIRLYIYISAIYINILISILSTVYVYI